MKTAVVAVVASLVVGGAIRAQEEKPVPKGSARVAIAGCSKDYVFTAMKRPSSEEETRASVVPAGTHLRMNAPRTMIAEIKAREGTMLEITGLVKQGQFLDGGKIGGVRIRPGGSPSGGGIGAGTGNPAASQVFIDVEGWRSLGGDCPR